MRRAFFCMLVLALAFRGAGCPCVDSAVNASPELRWWLFSNFGASKLCPEMLKRGVPLKLPQLGNASVGRFFPNQCFVQVDDTRKAIVMSASGTGYATLPVTRRVGFYVGMTVEYLPDFRLESDATYVWGQFSRFVSPPDLRIVGVENPVVNLATRTPAGDVATAHRQRARRERDRHAASPWCARTTATTSRSGTSSRRRSRRVSSRAATDHVVLASDLTQVHGAVTRLPRSVRGREQERRALLPREGRRRAARRSRVVERSVGEAWRRAYEGAQPMAAPPGAVARAGHARGSASRTCASRSRRARTTSSSRTRRRRRSRRSACALPVPEQPAYLSYSLEIGDAN